MVKHFCDRCGKETDFQMVNEKEIPEKQTSYNSYLTKRVELCKDCFNELKDLENKILPVMVNMKISMYNSFMEKGGVE